MRDIDATFLALSRSSFRRRFTLKGKERDYLAERSLDVVLGHARDLIVKRLAAAEPARDGKQTPYRGHPVFVAQHATATCCRGCLEKWHDIARGVALTEEDVERIVAVIGRWLRDQAVQDKSEPQRESDLFETPRSGRR